MLKLVIGNKNYSTWSLRPWLLLDGFAVEFEEQLVSLKAKGLTERLSEFSGSARVPVLIDNDLQIWDSLAICEHVNQQYLQDKAWPEKPDERALARAIVAEMHSGFSALRSEMPMNCRASRIVSPSKACLDDIARVEQIWQSYLQADAQGQLRLFGQFSIADCFYAPVVMRFKTYLPELSSKSLEYIDSISNHPSMRKWLAAALKETEIIEEDEAGIDR